MSGSGGGINTYNDYSNRPTVRDGVAVDGVKDLCDLYIPTQLANPDPNLVQTLSVNNKLNVVLNNQTKVVTAQDNNQQVVGIIAPPNLKKLIECIQQGNIYVATIIKINGGHITVEIHRSI